MRWNVNLPTSQLHSTKRYLFFAQCIYELPLFAFLVDNLFARKMDNEMASSSERIEPLILWRRQCHRWQETHVSERNSSCFCRYMAPLPYRLRTMILGTIFDRTAKDRFDRTSCDIQRRVFYVYQLYRVGDALNIVSRITFLERRGRSKTTGHYWGRYFRSRDTTPERWNVYFIFRLYCGMMVSWKPGSVEKDRIQSFVEIYSGS